MKKNLIILLNLLLVMPATIFAATISEKAANDHGADFSQPDVEPISGLSSAEASVTSTGWVGRIGVNYQPNHYSHDSVFNAHDVFYVDSIKSNIYVELAQLKAAGFSLIRSYQREPLAWVDLIKQADSLGLMVVYEARIPQIGGANDIKDAVSELKSVIDTVGADIFGNTVVLVFAGHENYNSKNATYLTNAIEALKTELLNVRLSSIPVGTALVSGDLATPNNVADIQKIINASSENAPLGFDPYPFQWGITQADKAVLDSSLANSIAWNYVQIRKQPFYSENKPILMAETGWATEGTTKWTWYYCNKHKSSCAPGLVNATKYMQAVYGFVREPKNDSSVMVFAAYDEPAKSPEHPDDAENHYGVFDTNCVSKNPELLPDINFDATITTGCLGYAEGSIFSVIGTQDGALKNQPPFSVSIQQKNPLTSGDTSMDVEIANQDRSKPELQTWPYFLIFNEAKVTITGKTSDAYCSFTAKVAAEVIIWSKAECSDADNYPVSCTGNTCYLPGKDF